MLPLLPASWAAASAAAECAGARQLRAPSINSVVAYSLDAFGGAGCIRIKQLIACLQLCGPVAIVRQGACGQREVGVGVFFVACVARGR
jgi:hypothetical protein